LTVSRQEAYDYLEKNREGHVATLQEWVRQPSVSTEPDGGVDSYAPLLVERYRDLGCSEAHVVETADPWPGVWAFLDSGASITIASYAYFDTYGVDEAAWSLPPYEGLLTSLEGHPEVIVGRGSTTKTPLAIWTNALEALAATEDGLPVNVLFLNEGAEMVGSPNFGRIVEAAGKHLDRVGAFLSPRSAEQVGSAEVTVNLGFKNMVTFDLECDGDSLGRGPRNGSIYGNAKSVIDSPTHRLIKALASLFGEDGNSIEIDGLQHVNEERKTVEAWERTIIDELMRRRDGAPWSSFLPVTGGVEHFVGDLNDEALLLEYLYGPSINVSELATAGVADNVKVTMLLPGAARAGVELRMVTDLDAAEIIDRVRQHLDARGFGDIRLVPFGLWNGHQQDDGDPVVAAVADTLRAHSREPVFWPIQPFGGPWAHVPKMLGVPAINGAALGYGAGGGSGADEYFVLESGGNVAGLLEAERFCVDLVLRYAELKGNGSAEPSGEAGP
jgi:acetylornithine deacetylase/succinyl-diaminopimelate desuccinylase-like protein